MTVGSELVLRINVIAGAVITLIGLIVMFFRTRERGVVSTLVAVFGLLLMLPVSAWSIITAFWAIDGWIYDDWFWWVNNIAFSASTLGLLCVILALVLVKRSPPSSADQRPV